MTEPTRSRKLLLNYRELKKIDDAVKQKGAPVSVLFFIGKGHLVKCEVAIAKGKVAYDKRMDSKDRDWSRQKQRLMRHS